MPLFSKMREASISLCSMEVSSHALDQERLFGCQFKYTVFMNLTREHLDYHGEMETYFESKKKLFTDFNRNQIAIIYTDDLYGKKLFDSLEGEKYSFGQSEAADFYAYDIETSLQGSSFKVRYKESVYTLKTQLPLAFNVFNATVRRR